MVFSYGLLYSMVVGWAVSQIFGQPMWGRLDTCMVQASSFFSHADAMYATHPNPGVTGLTIFRIWGNRI